MSDLRGRLAAVLDPFEIVRASDGARSAVQRSAEELADAALAVVEPEIERAFTEGRREGQRWGWHE